MNQQRSRRFRAAQEATLVKEAEDDIRARLIAEGRDVPVKGEAHFDSNCITPGTPFMDRLATCLHYYMNKRLSEDPAWANVRFQKLISILVFVCIFVYFYECLCVFIFVIYNKIAPFSCFINSRALSLSFSLMTFM